MGSITLDSNSNEDSKDIIFEGFEMEEFREDFSHKEYKHTVISSENNTSDEIGPDDANATSNFERCKDNTDLERFCNNQSGADSVSMERETTFWVKQKANKGKGLYNGKENKISESLNKTNHSIESMVVETMLNELGAKWNVFEAQSGKKMMSPTKKQVTHLECANYINSMPSHGVLLLKEMSPLVCNKITI